MNIEEVLLTLPASAEGGYTFKQYPIIQKVLQITKPTSVLEVGFNVGHSALMWLHETNLNLTSIDFCRHQNTKRASLIIKKKFPDRFKFINHDSSTVYSKVKDQKFDLIFIDGQHHFPGPISDLFMAYALGSKWVFVDDYEYVDVHDAVSLVISNRFYQKEIEFDYNNPTDTKAILLKRI